MTYTARDDLLDSFRAARIADEDAREERDLGYDTERAMHKAEGVRQPVTLRDFLRDAQPAKPSPDELRRVWEIWLRDCDSQVAITGLAYESATQARDAAWHDAVSHGGYSARALARLLGCSHQNIIKGLARHQARLDEMGDKR